MYVSVCVFVFQAQDEDGSMDLFMRNSLLFRKKTFGSMLDPHRKPGAVCTAQSSDVCFIIPVLSYHLFDERRYFSFQVRTGYDGLGGRTKFFQPVSFFLSCRIFLLNQCLFIVKYLLFFINGCRVFKT